MWIYPFEKNQRRLSATVSDLWLWHLEGAGGCFAMRSAATGAAVRTHCLRPLRLEWGLLLGVVLLLVAAEADIASGDPAQEEDGGHLHQGEHRAFNPCQNLIGEDDAEDNRHYNGDNGRVGDDFSFFCFVHHNQSGVNGLL